MRTELESTSMQTSRLVELRRKLPALLVGGAAVWSVVGCMSCTPAKKEPVVDASSEPSNADFGIDLSKIESNAAGKELPTQVRLTDVHVELGVEHVYENGQAGRALLAETTGGGCGWLDYDNDGFPDLYLNQGGDPTASANRPQPLDELYRNIEGVAFVPIANQSRVTEANYSQGVAVGDFDNDGFDDVYVTNVYSNTLWWNCGDGTFLEIASQAGVDDSRWSTSAAWADLDRDGDLDLYVCNYCIYDPAKPKECKDRDGFDKICNPSELEDWPDACFINQGNGLFVDEAIARGLLGKGNRALGVAVTDFDKDGLPDIYVANDTTDNFLFVNQGDGYFRDEATLRGCAVDRAGGPQGSMGIAIGDWDGNGLEDIYCSHYFEESNTLYSNFGELGFRDVTATVGLHRPTLNFLGFGTAFVDFDLDTQLELMVVNGHIDNSPRAADPKMQAQLFAKADEKRWAAISKQAGKYFSEQYVARGVATSDFDGDGDLDVAIAHENDPAAILRNDSSHGNWAGFRMIGTLSNRRGIGCRIELTCGDRVFTKELSGGTSYASSHEPVVVFGLGEYTGPMEAKIFWPSGIVQEVALVPNSYIRVFEEAP